MTIIDELPPMALQELEHKQPPVDRFTGFRAFDATNHPLREDSVYEAED